MMAPLTSLNLLLSLCVPCDSSQFPTFKNDLVSLNSKISYAALVFSLGVIMAGVFISRDIGNY
jgi:hypothetical protein